MDAKQKPEETSMPRLQLSKRYGYRTIFAYVPQTSSAIIGALKKHGFKNTGDMKCYYFIDGYYVDAALFGYS